MSVKCYSVPTFRCVCDKCGAVRNVEKDYDKIYNGAQAVRSLGWSFGKDKSVKCSKCRQTAWGDMYREKHKLYR